MSTRRKHLGCAVFNNFIYAVGGRDDCMELSSAERYKWVKMMLNLTNVFIEISYFTVQLQIAGLQL